MLLGARQFFERRGAPTPPLPYDAEVEYLESTGTQWIDTGIVARLGTSLRMQFSPRVAYRSFQNCFCGAANALNIAPHYDVNANGSKITVWNGGAFLDSSVQISADTMYNVYVDASTSSLTVDVNGIQATSSRQDGMYSDNSFYLFALNLNGQPQRNTQIRVYSFSLIYDGVLVRDFIPVRFTNEQGVSEGAMYDRVSGQVFRNAGTGAFTIGPDKS